MFPAIEGGPEFFRRIGHFSFKEKSGAASRKGATKILEGFLAEILEGFRYGDRHGLVDQMADDTPERLVAL
ncbi:MAG: hypothetical protein R3D85_04115 [Paracoccaceae bacterium]